jgi:hypothetical protein
MMFTPALVLMPLGVMFMKEKQGHPLVNAHTPR